MVSLESRARRITAQGCNVIARKGANPHRRVVLFAHIDAKMGTPGASDNAGGVIVMLLLAKYTDIMAGEPWYQGDHGLFLMNQVPALALTSHQLADLMLITHTPQDSPAIIDPTKLVTVALALRDLLLHLD